MTTEAPPAPTEAPSAAAPEAVTATPTPAPEATPAPPPPLLNPDGTFGENWHTALGDEFSPHAAQLGTYKDVKGLAKSLIHFRANGPAYPAEGATPEDVDRFRTMAKVPSEGTLEAYGIQLGENAGDDDRALVERIAKTAHEHHLSGPGFAAVVAEFQAAQTAAAEAMEAQAQAQHKAAEDALVAEWRGDFGANKSIVRHWTNLLAEQAGLAADDPSVDKMMENPAFGRLVLQFSKFNAEDSIRPPSGLGDLRSPQEKADAIMDGKDPVWGEKYLHGSTEDKVAAYRAVAAKLQAAAH